ncbi:hypothetical protein 28519:28740 forward MW:9092 [Clostridioides difficile M120]|uniref:hypothetical protein n=1 Tax=Clostridioides difficile TaxID=1496 RepID=UPI000CAA6BFD|nr:hypothetical protein [Clostridioides difficile]SHO33646.1 hypothetical protein 28519:28740 forward MW:9092 [Clostridioides difficile M120]
MKPIMNLEEHNAMKEKRVKKMKSKDKPKYDDFEDISFSNRKKLKKMYEIKMLNLEIIIKIISMITKKTFMNQFNIK